MCKITLLVLLKLRRSLGIYSDWNTCVLESIAQQNEPVHEKENNGKMYVDAAENDNIIKSSSNVAANVTVWNDVPGSDMDKKTSSTTICCKSDIHPHFLAGFKFNKHWQRKRLKTITSLFIIFLIVLKRKITTRPVEPDSRVVILLHHHEAPLLEYTPLSTSNIDPLISPYQNQYNQLTDYS